MKHLVPLLALALCTPAASAGPAEDAHALMVMHLSLRAAEAKPCPACGMTNCPCGCGDGLPCTCAVTGKRAVKVADAGEDRAAPACYYHVGGGKTVLASSWEDAYRKAGQASHEWGVPAASAGYSHGVPSYGPATPYGASHGFQGQSPSYGASSYGGGYSMPGYGGFGGASYGGGFGGGYSSGGGCASGSCGAGG